MVFTNKIYAESWEDNDVPLSYKVEMLPWDHVKELVPLKAKFTIIDIETGKQFNVQRRAGKYHADVQPLSTKDTRIMKEIYGGKWSWKRRAILVLVNDQLIAASMHGMPHGRGALKNNFPGHFCVHFAGSVTHRSKKEDLAHKLMVLRSAGKLEEYITQLSPNELVQVFGVAVHQKDIKILDQIMTNSKCPNCIQKKIEDYSGFKITGLPENINNDSDGLLMVEIPARVDIYMEDVGRDKRNVNFFLRRGSITDQWLIDQEMVLEDLE